MSRPSEVDDEYLGAWADAAGAAGDAETALIARRALGEDLDPEEEWGLTQSRVRQIARMTPRGAARLAAQWGSPWPDEASQ